MKAGKIKVAAVWETEAVKTDVLYRKQLWRWWDFCQYGEILD